MEPRAGVGTTPRTAEPCRHSRRFSRREAFVFASVVAGFSAALRKPCWQSGFNTDEHAYGIVSATAFVAAHPNAEAGSRTAAWIARKVAGGIAGGTAALSTAW